MCTELTLHAELFAFLRRLDRLIGRAIAAAEEAYGPESFTDRFRGLHISPDEVKNDYLPGNQLHRYSELKAPTKMTFSTSVNLGKRAAGLAGPGLWPIIVRSGRYFDCACAGVGFALRAALRLLTGRCDAATSKY